MGNDTVSGGSETMRQVTVALSLFVGLSCAEAAGSTSKGSVRKIPIRALLRAPESFCFDPHSGDYFITNVNGPPAAFDSNGFITRLGPDLSVKNARFIAGSRAGPLLNAPKGMAIAGGKLYVADINAVRAYDLTTGKEVRSLRLTPMRARFLNDLCVVGETLYVTDTAARKVFELTTSLRSAKVLCELKWQPNGIVRKPGTEDLLVVTWGPGKFLNVTAQGTVTVFFDGEPKGLTNLDGVVFGPRGAVYASSFTAGRIVRLSPQKKLSVVASGLKTPADIGIDRKGRLLVPLMQVNKACVLVLPQTP